MEYSKMWMNGTNSLIDPRYNDGRDRFPLYALTFWKELGRVVDQQESWQKASEWLEMEGRSADPLVGAMITVGQAWLGYSTSIPSWFHGYDITLPYSSLRNPSFAHLVQAQGPPVKTCKLK